MRDDFGTRQNYIADHREPVLAGDIGGELVESAEISALGFLLFIISPYRLTRYQVASCYTKNARVVCAGWGAGMRAGAVPAPAYRD